MKRLVALVVLASCWRSSTPVAPPPEPTIADLVPADTVTLARYHRDWFPPATYLHDMLPYYTECWHALEQRIEAGYQIWRTGQPALVIVEGNLPRAATETCLERTFASSNLLEDDPRRAGAFTTFDFGKLGTIHLAWRDRFVIIGDRDAVRAALVATPSAAWRQRIAAMPRAPIAATSDDRTMQNLLGIPTLRWDVVLDGEVSRKHREIVPDDFDALEQFGREQEEIMRRKQAGLPPEPEPEPPPPKPAIRGTVQLHYASTADAATAARRLETGAFALPFPLEQTLATALAGLPHTLRGATLEIRFAVTDFAGVELDALLASFARVQRAAP